MRKMIDEIQHTNDVSTFLMSKELDIDINDIKKRVFPTKIPYYLKTTDVVFDGKELFLVITGCSEEN